MRGLRLRLLVPRYKKQKLRVEPSTRGKNRPGDALAKPPQRATLKRREWVPNSQRPILLFSTSFQDRKEQNPHSDYSYLCLCLLVYMLLS
jgi:hypothetical protein